MTIQTEIEAESNVFHNFSFNKIKKLKKKKPGVNIKKEYITVSPQFRIWYVLHDLLE